MKKANRALWKCRAVGSEENPKAVFLASPSPWKSLTRFPHFHSADECGFLSKTQNQKGASPNPPSPRPFRLILR